MTEQQSHAQWRWRGRHIKIADGTMLSMPDTLANQMVFPQHGSQKEGAGFPIFHGHRKKKLLKLSGAKRSVS